MRLALIAVAFVFGVFTASNSFADDTVKIGWIGPLSGNSAVLGIDSLPAAQIAVDEVNAAGGIDGRKVVLLSEDDKHESTLSLTAYRKLMSQGAVAILMSTYGGFMAAAQSGNRSTVLVNPLDCNEEIAKQGENVFCVATLTESISRVIADHILAQKNTPTAIIYDDHHPFMTIVMNGIKARIPESDLIVTGIDQSTFSDYRSILLRFKAKGVKSIIFLGHDPMGQGMREARQFGLTSVFYTVGTITSPGFQKLAGAAANGTYVAYWEAPTSAELEKFVANFRTRVGREPILQLASVPSYDAVRIILTAIRSASSNTKSKDVSKNASESLQDSLLKIKNYAGLSGTISIDSDGVVRSISEHIYRFENGKLIP